MELELSNRMNLGLEQRFNLYQLILTHEILSMPTGALDTLLVAIASNPEQADKIMIEHSQESNKNGGFSIKSLYSGLVSFSKSKDDEKVLSGTIATFKPKDLSELVGKESKMLVTPDVAYLGRKDEKPIIEFAQHIGPKPEMSLLAIPPQFKKTANLYTTLLKEREFINKALRDQYALIGEKQREFLHSLRFIDMNIFSMNDVAKKLGFSVPLISRLRNNRLAKIGEKGIIIYVEMLMPTEDRIYRYNVHELLNGMFEEEIGSGIILSDTEVAKKIKKARRSVNKYRNLARIPDGKGRELAYKTGRAEAYHIPTTLSELVSG